MSELRLSEGMMRNITGGTEVVCGGQQCGFDWLNDNGTTSGSDMNGNNEWTSTGQDHVIMPHPKIGVNNQLISPNMKNITANNANGIIITSNNPGTLRF